MAMEGMSNTTDGGNWNSWNASATVGPLGRTCDPALNHLK